MSLLTGHELLQRLKQGERFIADGAMGTELIKRGVPMNRIVHANLEFPALVRRLHHEYIQAGSQIITANTFGVLPGEETTTLFNTGMKHAVLETKSVARDVGLWVSLTAKTLLSTKEYGRLFPSSWCVGVLVETCVSLEEVYSLVEVLEERRPGLVAVTCHFRANGTLPDGTSPGMLAYRLNRLPLDIIGANCGDTPESFVPIAEQMRRVTSKPLLFQPSAGLPTQNESGAWVYPVGPEKWAEVGMQLFAAGVNIVGGCCGTTPAHIAALAARMAEK